MPVILRSSENGQYKFICKVCLPGVHGDLVNESSHVTIDFNWFNVFESHTQQSDVGVKLRRRRARQLFRFITADVTRVAMIGSW